MSYCKREGEPLGGNSHYGRTATEREPGNAGESLFAEAEAEPKGQAGTEVPVLCVVRPDLSHGCAGGSMGEGARQQRRARSGWSQDRTDRDLSHRCSRVSEGNSGGAAKQDLYAKGGTTRLHSQSQWQVATAGNTHGVRPCG